MGQDIYPDKLILELRKDIDKNVWMRSHRSRKSLRKLLCICEQRGRNGILSTTTEYIENTLRLNRRDGKYEIYIGCNPPP